MRLALAFLVLLGASAPAWACPPPRDGHGTCDKYKRKLPSTPPLAEVLVRQDTGKWPKKLSQVMRHLTGSRWVSSPEAGSQVLLLVDGENVPETVDKDGVTHALIIHDVERTDGSYRVSLYGNPYQLIRCKVGKRTITCLARVTIGG